MQVKDKTPLHPTRWFSALDYGQKMRQQCCGVRKMAQFVVICDRAKMDSLCADCTNEKHEKYE